MKLNLEGAEVEVPEEEVLEVQKVLEVQEVLEVPEVQPLEEDLSLEDLDLHIQPLVIEELQSIVDHLILIEDKRGIPTVLGLDLAMGYC